eukprot:9494114-Pyramimonas_sp.AAC.1
MKIVEDFCFCCVGWLSPWAPSPTASRVTRVSRAARVCKCGCLPCLEDPPGEGACAYFAGCRCLIIRGLRW